MNYKTKEDYNGAVRYGGRCGRALCTTISHNEEVQNTQWRRIPEWEYHEKEKRKL